MRTGSTSLRSLRALVRVLLAAVVVGLGLAAAALLQPQTTAADGPFWACYSNSNHSLRSVSGPGDCAGNETAVRLDDSDNPIWICLHPEPGHIRYAGPADDDPITGNCWGAGSTQFFQLPGDNAITLCVHPTTGNLRFSPCAGNETPLVIPPRNRAPVAQDQNVSVDEDDDVQITLGATDPDGDPLTFAIVDEPDHGDLSGFNASTGEVTYTPDPDFSGPDSFTFTANDGSVDSNVATVSITVNPINDDPTDIALSNDSVDENEPGGTLVGTFTTTDPDAGDTHTYTLVNGTGDTDNAAFTISGSDLTINASPNFETQSSYSIRVQTDDGNGGTFTEVFTFHVNNVNEAPTAIAIDDTEIGENRPAGTAVGILSTTDPDAGDTFTYTFATGSGDDDNASFQLDGDRLESAEVFDFEVKSSYTVRIRSTDAGGLFTEEQFTITVVDLNDDPTDIALSNTTIAENVPDNFVVGTFSTTDQDAGDSHTYTLVAGAGDDDNGAFTISGSDLAINASPNFETQDSYSIRVQTDDGNGGTFAKSFTITVTDLNEAPTAGTDNYDAIGNTQLRINTPTSPAASVAFTSSGTSPLANDTDPDTNPAFNALQITAAGTCTKGGTLTLNAADQTDGRLTYLPPQGIESANAADTDDCTYTLSDGTNNVSGTVKVLITDLVWYVDNAAAAGGDGRSTAVYNSLAPLTTGGGADTLDNADDYIFVFQGNANYTGGFVLESGQRLFGQPNGLTVGATTLIAGSGANPTLTNSGGAGITLANDVEVQRIDVANTSGAGVTGTGVTNATIGGNTSITNTGGTGFDLSGAAGGNVTVGASISNTGGKQVSIQDRIDNGVTLDGAVSGTGTGVALANNTGATIRFFGGVNLSTGANNAFSATGGGAVEVTGTTNTITTTTGIALNVANTTIGSNDLIFQRISAGTAVGGPTDGIILNDTGTIGGLTVLGTGGSCTSAATCTGGAIQGATNYGISLTNTDNVSLTRMFVGNIGRNGIDGTGVTNFSFTNGVIATTGTAAAGQFEENAIAFVDSSVPLTDNTLDGAVTITGNTISNARRNAIMVETWSGTIANVNISSNILTGSSSPDVGDAIHVFAQGSASGTAHITTGSFNNNTISGFGSIDHAAGTSVGGSGIRVAGGNTGATTAATIGSPGNPITISGNAISTMGGNGITFSFSGINGQAGVTISNNGSEAQPMTELGGLGISVFFGGNVTGRAVVDGNWMAPNNIAGSSGIGVQLDQGTSTSDSPQGTYIVANNHVSDTQGNAIVAIGINNVGTMKVKIEGNTVEHASLAGRNGIRVSQNNGGMTICADIRSNTVTNVPGGSTGIVLRKSSTNPSPFQLVGFTSASGNGTAAEVEAYVDGLNPNGGGTFAGVSATTGFTSCSAFT